METIKIKIKDTSYSDSSDITALDAYCGCYELFHFEYRKYEDKWYFWPNSDFNPTIFEGKKFPMEYFDNLCKAKYFCYTGTDIWPEQVEIIAGKKLVGARTMKIS